MAEICWCTGTASQSILSSHPDNSASSLPDSVLTYWDCRIRSEATNESHKSSSSCDTKDNQHTFSYHLFLLLYMFIKIAKRLYLMYFQYSFLKMLMFIAHFPQNEHNVFSEKDTVDKRDKVPRCLLIGCQSSHEYDQLVWVEKG